jgi:hypothetical protein
METLLEQTEPTIALAAQIAPTLGQQQNAAALQALGANAAGAFQIHSDRLSQETLLMAAESRRFRPPSNSGEDGLRAPDRIGCPYCRRRTYLVRVRPLGNLMSFDGHCTTCGTNGR